MVRPTKAYKASLRKPKKEDYLDLLLACIETLTKGQKEIVLVVSHLTEFPEGFPKGLIVKTELPKVYRRIKATRLLKWLNSIGFSEVTREDLKVYQRKLTLLEKQLDL